MLKIGSHVSLKAPKYFLGSVEEALSYNSNTFMVYTGAPQNTNRKPINEMKIEEAHKLMLENNIDPKDIIIHAPYIINLAGNTEERRNFAVDFLTQEVLRTIEMGSNKLVLHPGSHVSQGVDVGINHIIKCLNQVIENVGDADYTIALETMSGKGTEVGRNFDELAKIIDGIKKPEKISICIDTCHIHDAGYDIVNNFDGVLEEFEEKIGIKKVSCMHINDSKNEIGANKDRHENLGKGYIGFDALINIIYHKDLSGIPKCLETPYLDDGDKKRAIAPYKNEIEQIKNKSIK